jgi:HTH-type transcriptional regulator/antitoxin HipB
MSMGNVHHRANFCKCTIFHIDKSERLCTYENVINRAHGGCDMLINTPRDLGSAIRERRKTLGLDQIELADRVGASRRWLIQVENGKPGASFGLLLRTMHALGMQMNLTTAISPESPSEEPLATLDLNAVLARARRSAAPE